jgi:hypothetical protein
MIVAKQEVKAQVFVENRELKQTTELKYLERVLASTGRIQAEIENRCCKAHQIVGPLTPIQRNKPVTLVTKRSLYNTILLPTLCYQCQARTLIATEKRKIVTTKMKNNQR